jgi:hypothetical protein
VLHDRLVGFDPGARSAASEGGGSRRDNYLLEMGGLAKQEEAGQGFSQSGEADSAGCVEGQVRDQKEVALQEVMAGWSHPQVPQVGTRGVLAFKGLRSDGLF